MAARKRNSQKPSTTLGHVTFSAKSSPKAVIENLPSEKEQLEQTIIEKFATALKTFTGRAIEILGRGDDPPNFNASEGGSGFGIELVEIRHPD